MSEATASKPDTDSLQTDVENPEQKTDQTDSDLGQADTRSDKAETELVGTKKPGKSSKPDNSNVPRTAANTSFVLVKVEKQHVPFVTLQFIFHSSISYLDRMRMLQKFKEKLSALNLKNLSSNADSPSSTPVQHSVNTRGESLRGAVSNLSNTNLAQTFDSSLARQKNHECCYLIQKPELFNALKTAFLDEKFIEAKNRKSFKTGEVSCNFEFFYNKKTLKFYQQKKDRHLS